MGVFIGALETREPMRLFANEQMSGVSDKSREVEPAGCVDWPAVPGRQRQDPGTVQSRALVARKNDGDRRSAAEQD
jgi:hypothetical protein